MIYFDNAATSSFKPFSVKSAVLKELCHSANPGRSGHDASIRAALVVASCREEIEKRFFHGNVVFTKNCTEALNLAIFGLKPRGAIITTVFEHNSVLRPLKKIADATGVELRVLSPQKGDLLPSLSRALFGEIGLVVFTAMSNVTGQTLDVGKLSKTVKEYCDAPILVDMAQAAGHVDVDLTNVDLCAFAGHKSLHGPQGSGFLLIKRGIRLSPLLYGGTGTSSLSLDQPTDLPEGMEAGTLNTVGIAGLKEGIRYTYDHFSTLDAKRKRVFNALSNGMKEINGIKVLAANNGILLMNFLSIDCSDAADRLNRYGICVRPGLHCAPYCHRYLHTLPYGAVRFSVGVDNTVSDVEKTLEIVEEIANTQNLNRI